MSPSNNLPVPLPEEAGKPEFEEPGDGPLKLAGMVTEKKKFQSVIPYSDWRKFREWGIPPRDPKAPPNDPKAPKPKTLPKPDAPDTPLSPRRTPLNCERSSAIGSIASLSRSRSRSRDEPELDPGVLPEDVKTDPVELKKGEEEGGETKREKKQNNI